MPSLLASNNEVILHAQSHTVLYVPTSYAPTAGAIFAVGGRVAAPASEIERGTKRWEECLEHAGHIETKGWGCCCYSALGQYGKPQLKILRFFSPGTAKVPSKQQITALLDATARSCRTTSPPLMRGSMRCRSQIVNWIKRSIGCISATRPTNSAVRQPLFPVVLVAEVTQAVGDVEGRQCSQSQGFFRVKHSRSKLSARTNPSSLTLYVLTVLGWQTLTSTAQADCGQMPLLVY